MTSRRIRHELKQLRALCIEGTEDLILKRLAYEIECAVRWASESGIREWPGLVESARAGADLLRKELAAPEPDR